jgi:hypothetical protein
MPFINQPPNFDEIVDRVYAILEGQNWSDERVDKELVEMIIKITLDVIQEDKKSRQP